MIEQVDSACRSISGTPCTLRLFQSIVCLLLSIYQWPHPCDSKSSLLLKTQQFTVHLCARFVLALFHHPLFGLKLGFQLHHFPQHLTIGLNWWMKQLGRQRHKKTGSHCITRNSAYCPAAGATHVSSKGGHAICFGCMAQCTLFRWVWRGIADAVLPRCTASALEAEEDFSCRRHCADEVDLRSCRQMKRQCVQYPIPEAP
eukprot:4513153-Amphidinium_carterae.1